MTSATLNAAAVNDEAEGVKSERPHRGCGWVEFLLFAVVSAGFFYLLMRFAGAGIMYTRLFWLDEYLTSLILLDKSVIHSIKAVAGGVDTNPPVYHLLLRAFYKIVGGPPETTFRLFSAVCAWGALVMVYATLRRGFGIGASLVGVLALTANPLIVKQSSEARFYAPLLFAAASFAFFYCGDAARLKNRLYWAGLALSAALVCTIHFFGIFILVSVIAGDWIARRLDRRRLIPAAAGPIALALMSPFAILQRRGMNVPTWIEPVNWDSFSQIFGVVWDMRPVCILLLAWFISLAWRTRFSGSGAALTLSWPALRPVAGLVGLFLVPLMVLAFSWLVQPSWVSKYAIAGALAVAPLAALIASWTRRVALVLAAVAMITLTFFQVKDFIRIDENRQRGVVNRGKHWRNRGEKQLFVYVVRNQAYQLHYTQPRLRRRIVLVDMSESGIEPPSKYHAYELQMATKVNRYYPFITLIKPQELAELGRSFDFPGSAEELDWLRQAVPLRKTADGFYKAVAPTTSPATGPAPAVTPATNATTTPASAAHTAAASDPPATRDAR